MTKIKGKNIYFILFALARLFLFGGKIYGQSDQDFKKLFYQSYYIGFKKFPPLREHWMALSVSKDVTDLEALSKGFDAVLSMYEATDSISYLNDAIILTNNVISEAQVTKNIAGDVSTFRDSYKGWTVAASSDTALFNHETVLSEVYFFQNVCRLLKDIHNKYSIYRIKKYKNFYISTFDFIETNIWDKWEERGVRMEKDKFFYLLLSRTHMASHWAYIAADLSLLTDSKARRNEYVSFVNLYNSKLENNFHKYGKYISWNMTWDDSHTPKIIQDVSHANLVIGYIVEAYDLGLWKDSDAVQRIINTVKDKLWDPEECIFRDNIDGTMFEKGQKGSVGSFQADGFVKLTRYDKSLFEIYGKFISCSKYLTAWYQYGQLFANLALSDKIISEHEK